MQLILSWLEAAIIALRPHPLTSITLPVALFSVLFQGCNKQQEHKWLYYDLDRKNGLIYQGYTITREDGEHDDATPPSPPLSAVPPLVVAGPPPLEKKTAIRNKPTVDEDDLIHFVVSGSQIQPTTASCQFVETPYKQPYDSKVVPQYKPSPPQLANARAKVAQAQLDFDTRQKLTEVAYRRAIDLQMAAAEAKDKADRAPSDQKNLKAKANEATRLATDAKAQYAQHFDKFMDAGRALDQARSELERLESGEESSIVCDLDVREKGSTKIDYVLANKKAKVADIAETDILLKDSILVHELYRFRILAGPVYSTVTRNNKNYQLSPDNAGQTVITATTAQDSPANFALFLKAYHTKRDVLDPPALFSNRWYETFNPIIGINLFDKPLQNFYAGISFEPWGGFDIVGGAHWAKTTQLVDGFSQGQVVSPNLTGFTKQVFSNGWFVGVTADVGIVTTWLKNAGSEVLGAFKSNP